MRFCMTLFSNYTNFGTVMLVIIGLMLFALLCPWRNLPTNLDTLLKSLWRLSGTVAVTWAIFVLVLIGTTTYVILWLIHYLGTVGTNTDHLRQIILAIPVLIAALAGLIALPVTLIRLPYTRRQTLAEEEGLITDRINAAVLWLGSEKIVKVTAGDGTAEHTEPNIEVRIGAILALERIAKNNLDVHLQIMELLLTYVQNHPHPNEERQVQYKQTGSFVIQLLVSPDIQIIADVFARRTPDQIAFEIKNEFRFDMSRANIRGVRFENSLGNKICDLRNFKFKENRLHQTKFLRCDLRGTNVNTREPNVLEGSWPDFQDCLFDRLQFNDDLEKFSFKENFSNFEAQSTDVTIPDHWVKSNVTGDALQHEWRLWVEDKLNYLPPHKRVGRQSY